MVMLSQWLAATPQTNPLPGLESAISQMNPLSQGACLLLLLVALICTGRYLRRGHVLTLMEEKETEFKHAFDTSAHALSIFQDQLSFPGSPSYAVYAAGSQELCFHLLGTDTVDNTFGMRLLSAGRITPSHMEVVRRAMQRPVASAAQAAESGLLGNAVRSLPFIGVLGTLLAWLEDFSNRTAGVSALIPLTLSVLLFLLWMAWHNALVRRSQLTLVRLEDFTSALSGVFDRAYVDHRKPLESLPSLSMMEIKEAPNFSLPPSDSSGPQRAQRPPDFA